MKNVVHTTWAALRSCASFAQAVLTRVVDWCVVELVGRFGARSATSPSDLATQREQTRAQSAWRRLHVHHRRSCQAAWLATQELAREPQAWLLQAFELSLFSIKGLCAYWALVDAVLLTWCLATGTRLDEVSPEGKSAATAFVSFWLLMFCAGSIYKWSIYKLRIPIESLFVDVWRKTYDEALSKPKPREQVRR